MASGGMEPESPWREGCSPIVDASPAMGAGGEALKVEEEEEETEVEEEDEDEEEEEEEEEE